MKRSISIIMLMACAAICYAQTEQAAENTAITVSQENDSLIDSNQHLTEVEAESNQLRFIMLSQDKVDRKNINTIQIYNHQAQLLKAINAGESRKNGGRIFHFDDPDRFYYYAYENGSKARLKIYNKTDFSLVAAHDIEPLYEEVIVGTGVYSLAGLNADKSRLFMHVGKKKTQEILIFDVRTGVLLQRVPLGKYKTKVTAYNLGDVLVATVNTGKNRSIQLIDVETGQVKFKKVYEYKDVAGFVHGDYVFYAYVTGKRVDTVYQYYVRNFVTGELQDFKFKSYSQLAYAENKDKSSVYIVGNDIENNKSTTVFKFNQGSIERLPVQGITIKPQKLLLDNQEQQLLILGKSDLTVVSLRNPSQAKLTDLPFDVGDVVFNESGSHLYLKEGAGSEVALIDVASGEKLARTGTGRPGVKFGQFMASAALLGVGLNSGYVYFAASFSRTGMILNHAQNRLFVINSKTNDVTLLNADDLSGREAIATGGGTYMVYQLAHESAPIMVLSQEKINWINGVTGSLISEFEFDVLSGIHFDHGLIFVSDDEQTRVFSMKTSELVVTLPGADVRMVNVL
ncbi:MAG: hypothetical protein DWP95_05600 [Proteobacteria bacterium]|nr:MAG: hypothetical protein DWP95_05600 [Pseudomonadota bacterium]